jgi:hypothetical protein
LDARLKILLCKKIIVSKYKEVKPGWFSSRPIWQNLLRKAVIPKVCFADDDDDDDGDDGS